MGVLQSLTFPLTSINVKHFRNSDKMITFAL